MDERQYLNNLLDKCIALSLDGMSIEAVLALYPEHENWLKPLLQTAMAIRQVPQVVPSLDAKLAGWQHLSNAIVRKRFELLYQGDDPQEKMPVALVGT